jgi:hypothetical protein
LPTEPLTRCWLDTCRDIGHVVLYASGDRFAGLQTRPRQPIVLCLAHGGQLYDQIRVWRAVEARNKPLLKGGMTLSKTGRTSSSCPNWLISDLRNGRLPRTSPDPSGWPTASPFATNKPRKGR